MIRDRYHRDALCTSIRIEVEREATRNSSNRLHVHYWYQGKSTLLISLNKILLRLSRFWLPKLYYHLYDTILPPHCNVWPKAISDPGTFSGDCVKTLAGVVLSKLYRALEPHTWARALAWPIPMYVLIHLSLSCAHLLWVCGSSEWMDTTNSGHIKK